MAITSVYYAPSYLQGVGNPIMYSFESDEILEANFQYVIDVVIDEYVTDTSPIVIRIKQRPNPAGVCMIDVSKIAQQYLTTTRIPEQTINSLFADNTSASMHMMLLVGEEYGGVMYNGLGGVGNPEYEIWSNTSLTAGVNVPVSIFQSSVDWKNQQYGMSFNDQYSGAYGPSVSNPTGGALSGKNYDWGLDFVYSINIPAYPLSHNTLRQVVGYKDVNVLSHINWSRYMNGSPDLAALGLLKIAYYDDLGNILHSEEVQPSATTGFDLRPAACTPSAYTDEAPSQYDIIHTDCKLETLWNYLITFAGIPAMLGGYYMEVTFYIADMPCATTGYAQTQTSRFTLDPNDVTAQINGLCIPDLATASSNATTAVTRLSWLNELGGRDYYNFTSNTEQVTTTTQDTYYQEEMNWSETLPIPIGLASSGTPDSGLNSRGGNKVYNKMAITSWNLVSDWITTEESIYLAGLFKSPQVLAYVQDTLYNTYVPYSVQVTNSEYTAKNVNLTKMVQVELTIQLDQIQRMINNI